MNMNPPAHRISSRLKPALDPSQVVPALQSVHGAQKIQKKHKKQTIYIYIAYHSLPIAYQYGLYLYIVYMWFGNVWYIKIKT